MHKSTHKHAQIGYTKSLQTVQGNPFFVDDVVKLKQYPYVDRNLNCDILIVGGGIDGATLNYYLSKNHNVILVDKSRIGHGATSVATALLEWQLDDFCEDLENELTHEQVCNIYSMGLCSVQKIKKLIKKHGNYCNFREKSAFLFTNSIFQKKSVQKEHEFRIQNGFDSTLFTKQNNPYSFPIQAGLFSKNGGAEFNPYLFTKQMIECSKNQNKIYENTDIIHVENAQNKIVATSSFGEKIYCNKIIYATGFNHSLYSQKSLCDLFVSYSIIIKVPKQFSWHDKSLMQDNSSPYHYFRFIEDGTIIFGGEDSPYRTKISKNKAERKYKVLEKTFLKLFPELCGKIKITHKFCGLFGETKNNLGLIGRLEKENHLLFSSAGANGIINAFCGVEIIEDILSGKKHQFEDIFSPLREK